MAIHYRLHTGPGNWAQQFTGTLDLGAPALLNLGNSPGGEFYRIDFGISGTLSIGTTLYTFSGSMRIQDQGAGLWDATFKVPVSGPAGQHYSWESTNGTFFSADGSTYPSAQGASSIAYSLYPEKIEFFNSVIQASASSGSSPALGLGTGTLVAERICLQSPGSPQNLRIS